mgnify:CR=1 FL=1
MRRHLYNICLIFTIIGLAGMSLVAFPDEAQANRKYASVVMEANTGRILYARNVDKRLHPASLTKMMTLLLTFEAIEKGELSKRERIYISRRAASMVPSKLGLPHGSTIRVEDAVYALVTKSANDVAVALAEHLAGTEWRFSRLMTQKAHLIGMRKTQFQNASGLYHPYQRSTARDMAILSRYLIMNYPQYYRYFSTASFRYRGKTYHNHNRLMRRYDGMDGLKTGYIAAAGFNLAASAVRGNTRLIGVVYGGRSTRTRDRHMARILDSSFVRARQIQIANAQVPVPPEKPGFRKVRAIASAGSAQDAAPFPNKKPDDLAFGGKSSFKLARFDTQRSENNIDVPDAEAIPPEHFEMLAKVLGSESFNRVIGQGDYDPTVLSRIETGLLALSAHTGEDKLTLNSRPPAQNVDDDLVSVGKRVLGRIFSSDKNEEVASRLINGLPVPPMLPENRLWDEAKQDSWSVQIGAFNDRARTNDVLDKALAQFASDLGGAKALVIPTRSGNQIVYRARLTRLDRDRAFAVCKKLRDCMPIAP